MKKIYKNIITISLGILLIGAVVITIICAKNNSQPAIGMGGDKMMEPPETMNVDDMDTQFEPPEENGNFGDMGTPPEKPEGNDGAPGDMGTPPEKPEGDDGAPGDMGTPPELPNSEQQGDMPSMPNDIMDGNPNASLSIGYCALISIEILLLSLVIAYLIMSKFNQKNFKETFISGKEIAIYILASTLGAILLTIGIILLVNNFILSTTNNMPNNNMSPNNGMGNNSNVSYSAATEITQSSTVNDKAYESTKADENSLSISGEIEVAVNNVTVEKTGDSDGGDNTSFYGTNSAIIAKSSAILNLKNATITTDATGANGVFSYGGSATTNNDSNDGTTINISDSTIITKKDGSGGIMATGGGIINASNLTIETAGTSSAAIRSDRGGGEINVDGGTYKTTGQGSPSIYSTANIVVKNATLIATVSEGAIIEGKNSIYLDNVTLTDSNTKLNGQSTTYKNIFLYQSMSGDADDGTSEFSAKNSIITTNRGDSFYVTNTTARIALTDNTIINNDSAGNFLRIKADSWGNSGSNGGAVSLTLNNQSINGNIVVDSISTLDMTMRSGSIYTGIINGDNTGEEIKLKLDDSSKITLTGDSYVSSLEDEDEAYSNIDFNGYKLYVDGKAIK